jgi:tetratricopeptide (TPR) repeat protein
MPPDPADTPDAPRSVLTGWQRPFVKAIVLGTILVAGTGLFLLGTPGGSPSFAAALLVHVAVGALLVLPLLAFTLPHAIAQTRRKPLIALSGAVLLLGGLLVALSGAALVFDARGAMRDQAWWAHVVGGFGLVVLYAVHRRFGQNPASVGRLASGAAALVGVGAGFLLWEASSPGALSEFEAGSAEAAESTRALFFPSLATSGAGGFTLTADDIKDVSTCATCHRQIVDDWKRSAHRHASMTNPFYRATVEDIRKRFPAEDTRWCAGCHDPALLFTGKMVAKDLDFDSEDARVGLSCMSCHAIDPQSTLGNGDYVMRGRKVYPGEKSKDPAVQKAHEVMLRLNPKAHVESLRPKNIQEPGFCSLCHKAEPPQELNRWHWFPAQTEYDDHDNSGVSRNNALSFYLPPQAKRCQDCHMPLVSDPDDPAADEKGMVRSHIFAAANTALPHLRGDTDMIQKQTKFLQTACRVDVTAVVLPGERRVVPAYRVKPAVAPGDVIEADVVVRNVGVGHRFPGGTKDCQEVWLRFEASVGDAEPFYVSGWMDPKTGEVDPSAEFYRGYLLKRDGKRFANRIGLDIYTPVYAKLIGPGTADVVRYRLRVPEGSSGTLKLKATLRYRKFIKEFLDFVATTRGGKDGVIQHRLDEDYLVPGKTVAVDISAAKMPVVDMAGGTSPVPMWATLELPIAEKGLEGAPPDPAKVALPEDRDRVNDFGIALLLQGDPYGAMEVFEAVTRIDPAYADGWVNVARAKIDAQDDEGASVALATALALNPEFPKALYFQGEIHRRKTQYGLAEKRFASVLAAFPRHRDSLRRLAEVQYEQKRYDDALATLDRLKAIDPEDANAWFLTAQCYLDLGDAERVKAARAAYDKFRPDDSIQERAGPVLLADPNLHRLAQKIHAHEQPGVGD